MARGGSVEQRRSERRECRIPVEVVDGQRRCVGTTIDVSRHGLFLEVEATLQERFLVQLVLHLPDGPLTATGFVVRVAPPGARRAGVGIQFFALSAASKHRWDYFVYGLTGAHTPTPDLAGQNPEQATFLIKLRDQARLAEFVERNVARGALYMATPVIKPEGTGIVLILVHPNTEEEYVLSGSVARVCREPPKGMEVHFPPPSAAEMPPLWTFVRTGHLPRPPPKADTPPPTPREPSQDIPIDIEVEETALDESARFSWDDISDYRMVVDFELANQDTLDLRPRARPEGKKRLEITMEVQAPGRDGDTTVEMPAPAALLARARPSSQHPAPTTPAPEVLGRAAQDGNARQSWRWQGSPSSRPAQVDSQAPIPSEPPQFLELDLGGTPDVPAVRAPSDDLNIQILEPEGAELPISGDLPILEAVEGDFDKIFAPDLEAKITGSLPRITVPVDPPPGLDELPADGPADGGVIIEAPEELDEPLPGADDASQLADIEVAGDVAIPLPGAVALAAGVSAPGEVDIPLPDARGLAEAGDDTSPEAAALAADAVATRVEAAEVPAEGSDDPRETEDTAVRAEADARAAEPRPAEVSDPADPGGGARRVAAEADVAGAVPSDAETQDAEVDVAAAVPSGAERRDAAVDVAGAVPSGAEPQDAAIDVAAAVPSGAEPQDAAVDVAGAVPSGADPQDAAVDVAASTPSGAERRDAAVDVAAAGVEPQDAAVDVAATMDTAEPTSVAVAQRADAVAPLAGAGAQASLGRDAAESSSVQAAAASPSGAGAPEPAASGPELPAPDASELARRAALEAELEAEIEAALHSEATEPAPTLALPAAVTARVWCAGCDGELGVVRLGPEPGYLGLVAESKPYWNPDKRSLVSVLRPRASEERAAARAALQGDLTEPVPLELLFVVVDLNRPPADPDTGGRVRVNSLVKAVWAAQETLQDPGPLVLPSARCPACRAGPVLIEAQRGETPPR